MEPISHHQVKRIALWLLILSLIAVLSHATRPASTTPEPYVDLFSDAVDPVELVLCSRILRGNGLPHRLESEPPNIKLPKERVRLSLSLLEMRGLPTSEPETRLEKVERQEALRRQDKINGELREMFPGRVLARVDLRMESIEKLRVTRPWRGPGSGHHG